MEYGQIIDRIGTIASIEESKVKVQLIGQNGTSLVIKEFDMPFVMGEHEVCHFTLTKIALQDLCKLVNNPSRM